MMDDNARFSAGYFDNMSAQAVVPISRKEMERTQREMEEFSLIGFQVVRREFFSHRFSPTLTIKGNSIIFNNACIRVFENVVYVQLLINPDREQLVIKPCEEGDKNAIRWCIVKEDKTRRSRQITCDIFAAKLYDLMGWERVYRYKIQGSVAKYQGMVMYVFDLTSTEIYRPQTKEGELNRNAPMYPESWRDSFGMAYEEHEKSAQINLDDGFAVADAESDVGDGYAEPNVGAENNEVAKGEAVKEMAMELV